MREITEQQIMAMAQNATAVSNARKIVQKGGFLRLFCSADDTFYMGECSGSGKSTYVTSADFLEETGPVCRCSCPSRQFPCKHALALLFEIQGKKEFTFCEIPEDILKKRERKQNRTARKTSSSKEKETVSETEMKKKAASSRSSQTARTKKIKKQLEGLALAKKMIQDLLKAGLGTMAGSTWKTYEQLSKQLGDYYLTGPQRLLNSLILEIASFQKDGKEEHYENAIHILEKMWTLVQKSETYLSQKLLQDETAPDNSQLYEELGEIWKLSQLEEIGNSRQNVNLLQLAFWVTYEESRKEFIDTGCWGDLATGEIFLTHNYRPKKALKYVKQEDSIFGVAEIPSMAYYPGEGNLRVRWEGAAIRPAQEEDFSGLWKFGATSLAKETKTAKNTIKNVLSNPIQISLVSYELLGKCEEGYVLKNQDGETILLGDCPYLEASTHRIGLLPDSRLLENQILLGAFYYHAPTKRMKLHPISILTKKDVVRLLY